MLKVKDEKSRIRIQDPDPLQNVMDPEHWFFVFFFTAIENFNHSRFLLW